MSGQGHVAKSIEIDVVNDVTTENIVLVNDVESVTVENKDTKTVNKAAPTAASTSLEESGMEDQETIVPSTTPPPPMPSSMKVVDTTPPKVVVT